MSDRFVYKLLTAEDWAKAEAAGVTSTALDDADGYVHLSARDQVAETARLHYRGKAGCVLLEFDAPALGAALKWEPSRGGALFPHLYGALKVAAATRRWTLSLDTDGAPIMPGDL
ncbi:MAG: DUF952 domain-containing protein [Pseudomonadota bacterium]